MSKNSTLTIDEHKLMNQLTCLVDILKAFGWTSPKDTRTIKPNIRSAQLYLRRHSKELKELFPDCNIPFETLSKQSIVDEINPLLIHMWHIQIIGNTSSASLELLRKTY